ncbi:MAG: hypothetical protein HYU36_06585 [Planctomycetes bacterium]|nr:hypothetical protein [Planctomycetota bacterium]
MANTILEEDVFPIVGWAGPGDNMIRDDVMAGMAQAGFTVSHSSAGPALDAVLQALDVAHHNGVRLLLVHPAYHVGDDFKFTQKRKKEVKQLVEKIREHPGLYGYHLRDEPRFHLLPLLAEVGDFIRALDPYHLIYINHFPPTRGWGAPTVEWFWREYIRLSRPQMLSYDHYCITIGTNEDLEKGRGQPNVFPDHKIIVKPDYFECLDLLRALSSHYSIPFWAFTCSVRHGAYPPPTEGHIRFQLFNNLAYGAKGLQYFTYAHDQAMVRPDGSTTETWELARQINAEIHTLAPVLRRLRNVGVFHNGSLWSGTRRLQKSGEPLNVNVLGDQVTAGFFLDEHDLRYVLVVNANPCAWARITIEVNVKEEKLYGVDPRDRTVREIWPPNPKAQLIALSPGEGKLFQIGGQGQAKNF